jgi:hypothetical protein
MLEENAAAKGSKPKRRQFDSIFIRGRGAGNKKATGNSGNSCASMWRKGPEAALLPAGQLHAAAEMVGR